MKLGIIANEFYDASFSRMGGFGWALKSLVQYFTSRPELGVEIVILGGQRDSAGQVERRVHGVSLIFPRLNLWQYALRLRRERIDCLLCIDYRPEYRVPMLFLPATPVLFWVRDPRSPEDDDRRRGLCVPGERPMVLQGSANVRCRTLGPFYRIFRLLGRRFATGMTADEFRPKLLPTYGAEPGRVLLLPNLIALGPTHSDKIAKSPTPLVLFLGRLDPIKRPWLVVELARRMPHINFAVLGQTHFQGQGGWQVPSDIPENLSFLGHIEGEAKHAMLASAWLLLNTSIHEGLAVSFLEALHHRTPIVAAVDTEKVVSRFGAYVGFQDGSGLESVPAFQAAIELLVRDEELRTRLGREGSAWVQDIHAETSFLRSLHELLDSVGVPTPSLLQGAQR